MLYTYNKLVAFAYSFQGANQANKEKKSNGRKYPCNNRSYYGDFKASNVDEIKDLFLYVKNSDSKDPWIKLSVNLKKHSIPFKCLCVCDGHDSPAYFRSGRGAELAIQSYVELLSERIEKLVECYKTKDFRKIETGLSVGIARDRWTKKIVEDLIKNPISKEDLRFLRKSDLESLNLYQKECIEISRLSKFDEILNFMYSSSLRRIYACTFIAYVQVEDFWYAMQVGNGDFAISYDGINFLKPIKDDPRCIGNITTSLCTKESYNDFRFSHGEEIPKCVFCSSNEISDSLLCNYDLFNLYKWVVNRFTSIEIDEFTSMEFDDNKYSNFDDEIQKVKQFIAESIFAQSERGSGDDFSLATILNFNALDFPSYKKSFVSLEEAFRKEIKEQLIQEFEKVLEQREQKLEEKLKQWIQKEFKEEIKEQLLQEINSKNVLSIIKKPLVLFFLIDTSSNMNREKIQTVNEVVCEILPIISDIAKDNVEAEVKIATLSFNEVANWETPFPVKLEDYKYKDLFAGGVSLMGEAFFELNSKLDENAFLSSQVGNYAPIIILLSAGKPNGNYRRGLSTLKQNKYFEKGIKIAFAIGKDANKDILAEFTGNVDLVLEVNNKIMLKKLVRFVSDVPALEYIDIF